MAHLVRYLCYIFYVSKKAGTKDRENKMNAVITYKSVVAEINAKLATIANDTSLSNADRFILSAKVKVENEARLASAFVAMMQA